MLNLNIINLVKYPWTAGIIGIIWISSAVLVMRDTQLPVVEMVAVNMVVSTIIAMVGFRVER